jgi:hypothetical protein
LSDARGRDCAVSCARMYREQMRKFSRMDPLQIWYAETSATDFIESLPKALQKNVTKRIQKAAAGSEFDFPKLAGSVSGQIRITDQPPLIFHPESTGATGAMAPLEELFHIYRESLSLDRRVLLDRYRLVDVAIKVVGREERERAGMEKSKRARRRKPDTAKTDLKPPPRVLPEDRVFGAIRIFYAPS